MKQTFPEIEVFSDPESLSRRAAAIFVQTWAHAMASKGRFAVALSGGTTPRRCYTLLGSDEYRKSVDWRSVHVFWADERSVPPDHRESNFRLAFEALLSKVSLPEINIHRIRGEEEPGKASRDYEEEMQRFFGTARIPVFDLLVLGVGTDGHTASLFPGTPGLKETTRLAVPVYKEKPEFNRVSLTIPVLSHGTRILFLASGQAKARIIGDLFGEHGGTHQYPAGLISPVEGCTTWLIDEKAASEL